MESALPGVATLGLAFVAGLLTTLSPCVLPVLPMVAASATGRSRWGLFTLIAGLALTFTVIGVALASSGQLFGLDDRSLRPAAGGLLTVIGLILLSTRLRDALARVTGALGNAGGNALTRIRSDHPAAQFGVGMLMGVAWSPCVGPTLGAAIGLAASGGGTPGAAMVMSVFSVAAVLPLALVGLLGRGLFERHRQSMLRAGDSGRKLMGWSLLAIGLLVVTGIDKWLEAQFLVWMPEWLVALTTRY